MKLVLCDTNVALVNAWKQVFSGFAEVEIHTGSIFADTIQIDALVSPANSFGFMDGGFDGIITDVLGPQVQESLQDLLIANHHGELLVGQAAIIPTGRDNIPYVISAPTMRVPMILSPDSINVYLATLAVLNEIKEWNAYLPMIELRPDNQPPINSVGFTGLGTGIGRVTPMDCATQMFQAYEDFVYGLKFPTQLREASVHHKIIMRGKRVSPGKSVYG